MIPNPRGRKGARKTGQLLWVSDLALEPFPTSFVTEAQLAHVPELITKVEAASGKVLAVGGNQFIVVIEIQRIAVRLYPGSDEPAGCRSERVVILRSQPVLGKQNDVIAPFG